MTLELREREGGSLYVEAPCKDACAKFVRLSDGDWLVTVFAASGVSGKSGRAQKIVSNRDAALMRDELRIMGHRIFGTHNREID